METVKLIIQWLIFWILVPGIFLGIIVAAIGYAQENAEEKGIAGVGAGFILLVLYIILFQTTESHIFAVTGFFNSIIGYIILFILGSIIGFILYWLAKNLNDASVIGIMAMIIIAAASSALYSYFFFSSGIRNVTEYIALGILFGVFVHFVVSQ